MAALTTVLVAGGTGATGQHVVRELLDRGAHVRAVARNPGKLGAHERLSVIPAAILDLEPAALAQHVQGCDAVASCLGHNLTWSGVFGPPHRLVTDATRRLCDAFRANPRPRRVRFVLMNTTGNRNPDCDPAGCPRSTAASPRRDVAAEP